MGNIKNPIDECPTSSGHWFPRCMSNSVWKELSKEKNCQRIYCNFSTRCTFDGWDFGERDEIKRRRRRKALTSRWEYKSGLCPRLLIGRVPFVWIEQFMGRVINLAKGSSFIKLSQNLLNLRLNQCEQTKARAHSSVRQTVRGILQLPFVPLDLWWTRQPAIQAVNAGNRKEMQENLYGAACIPCRSIFVWFH